MREQVEKIINDEIQPALFLHGGGVELVEVTDDNIVKIKLTGACSSCPGRQHTVEQFVETAFKEALPGISKVVLENQVSDELIGQALAILRKGK